jgi:hypothetical protein
VLFGHRRASILYRGVLLLPDFAVEPIAESLGQLVLDTISHESYNILGTVKDSRAVGADFEMRFHARTQLRVNIPVNVVGDLSPDLEAAYLNHLHRIQMVPFSFMRLGAS